MYFSRNADKPKKALTKEVYPNVPYQFTLIYISLFRSTAYESEVVASFPFIRKHKISYSGFYKSLHVVKLTLTFSKKKQGSLLISNA